MKTLLIAVAALAVLPAAGAMAGDDCHVGHGAWQPREAVMQAVTGRAMARLGATKAEVSASAARMDFMTLLSSA